MKKKVKHKTFFSMMIENNEEGHELSIALGMVGMEVSPLHAKLILDTQASLAEMGGQFDLKTAAKLKTDFQKKIEKLKEKYVNQESVRLHSETP